MTTKTEQEISERIAWRHSTLAKEPMPEHEFAKLTFAGFKQMTDDQQEATLRRMDKEQFNRWLDRCQPPKHGASLDSFTDSVFRRRSVH